MPRIIITIALATTVGGKMEGLKMEKYLLAHLKLLMTIFYWKKSRKR